MGIDGSDREPATVERWNAVFGALQADPRRQIVISLIEAPPEQEVPLPAAAIASHTRTDPEALTVALVHRHLPKLAERGFVEWSLEPLRAVRGPNFEEVAAVFEALESTADAVPDRLVDGCPRLEDQRLN